MPRAVESSSIQGGLDGREARNEGTLIVRRASAKDVPEIVGVHLSSFPGFFLTFLGRRFLELLYQEIQAEERGILLVSETDGKINGFVAGVTEQAGFYRRLLTKRKWSFALAAARAVVRRPGIAPRLFRALGKPKDVTSSTAACLMSVAVNPGSSSTGLGAKLVSEFTSEMRRRSVTRYCLTTDRDANDKVNAFYRKRGFVVSQSYQTPEGRWMNEYVMDVK